MIKQKDDTGEQIPQIKICGITRVSDAISCAKFGADALGFVFYPKSPRNITRDTAREISLALPEKIKTVGVFVDESFSSIMKTVEKCGLSAVQLHGNETPQLVADCRKENLIVIKALFLEKRPSIEEVNNYEASAFIVEYGKGALPGGNALSWEWEKAKTVGENYPLILAGGLSPDNISTAISLCSPDAVDISSGVESSYGIKDIAKVESFISIVSGCTLTKTTRRIF
ncbi:MAG: phosphoribosylanthranilate isomerase [Desulfobacterium sp.]|nr:phosphoribosylanthranilate isomerase [Desulfobacterium sp.]MBU3950467.1 phosphoribosylanthranilate isomerase [Pseudomonadota bacterium]MBU4036027.1 phosphoribosylanthranilate isomerase [Pseudomonadota bacterium]